jgi:hypothetical protein
MGFSPHFLMTGQVPRWNIDFVLINVDSSVQAVLDCTSSVLDCLAEAFVIVREHSQQSVEVARTWYKQKVEPHLVCVGDRVRAYNLRRYRGESPKWQSFDFEYNCCYTSASASSSRRW